MARQRGRRRDTARGRCSRRGGSGARALEERRGGARAWIVRLSLPHASRAGSPHTGAISDVGRSIACVHVAASKTAPAQPRQRSRFTAFAARGGARVPYGQLHPSGLLHDTQLLVPSRYCPHVHGHGARLWQSP